LHDSRTSSAKRERHDPDKVSAELVEEVRRLAEAGKGRQFISEKLGLAWRTLDAIGDKHGIGFKRNRRTDDEIRAAVDRFGGLDRLVATLRATRSEGKGWQGLAECVGLNRYACRVLVEEGRVPSYKNCKGRKANVEGLT
jgi:hypothetical protein